MYANTRREKWVHLEDEKAEAFGPHEVWPPGRPKPGERSQNR